MGMDERSDLPVLSRPFYRMFALRLFGVAIGVGLYLAGGRKLIKIEEEEKERAFGSNGANETPRTSSQGISTPTTSSS